MKTFLLFFNFAIITALMLISPSWAVIFAVIAGYGIAVFS